MTIETHTKTILNNKLPNIAMFVKVQHGTIGYKKPLILAKLLGFKVGEVGMNFSKEKVRDWLWFDEEGQIFKGKDAQRINREFAKLRFLIEDTLQKKYSHEVIDLGYKIPSWEALKGTIEAHFNNTPNHKGLETFGKVCSQILHNWELNKDVAENTIKNYRQTRKEFENLFLPKIGKKPHLFTFQELDFKVLNQYIQYLKDKGNGNDTIEVRISHLRKLYEGAVYYFTFIVGNKHLLTEAGSPFSQLEASKQYLGIKKKKNEKRKFETQKGISEQEFIILRNWNPSKKAVSQREYLDYFLLQCSMGGLRISELLNLRYEDIDLENGKFSSLASKTGKYRHDQIFDILGITRSILSKFWDSELEATNHFILPIMRKENRNASQIDTADIVSKIDVTLKKVGLRALGRSISTHDARKFVGNYIFAKAGYQASQLVLGHTNLDTTRNHYISQEVEREELNKILQSLTTL